MSLSSDVLIAAAAVATSIAAAVSLIASSSRRDRVANLRAAAFADSANNGAKEGLSGEHTAIPSTVNVDDSSGFLPTVRDSAFGSSLAVVSDPFAREGEDRDQSGFIPDPAANEARIRGFSLAQIPSIPNRGQLFQYEQILHGIGFSYGVTAWESHVSGIIYGCQGCHLIAAAIYDIRRGEIPRGLKAGFENSLRDILLTLLQNGSVVTSHDLDEFDRIVSIRSDADTVWVAATV